MTQTLFSFEFSKGLVNLKSEKRASLSCREDERVLEGFYSCNLRFSKPRPYWSKCWPNICNFSNLFSDPELIKIWSEKLSILWTVCGVFVDFFCSDISSFCQHSPHCTFSLLVHMHTIALSILFSSNAFKIMSKVSALYLENFRPTFLCMETP